MESAIFLLILGVVFIVCSKITVMTNSINLSVELFGFKPFTKEEIREFGMVLIRIGTIIIAWICITKELELL